MMKRYKGHLQYCCLLASISAKLHKMIENALVLNMNEKIPKYASYEEHR